MIKYCIFDLDGTLLDTLTTICYFVNETLLKDSVNPITEEECRMFVGNGAKKLIYRAMNSKGIYDDVRIEKALNAYNNAYDNNPFYLTKPYPGILKVLSDLKTRGIKLAVLSNKPDSTVKSVINNFFPDIFDVVRGGQEGVPLKPDPASAEDVLNELSANLSELAFIGDSSVDIETGKNLGAEINIGVLWGFRDRKNLEAAGADIIASCAEDLVKIITENN